MFTITRCPSTPLTYLDIDPVGKDIGNGPICFDAGMMY